MPILGTSPDAIDLAEDRERFQKLIETLRLKQPRERHRQERQGSPEDRRGDRLPVVIRPSYVLGAGRAMEIVHDTVQLERYITEAVVVSGKSPVLIDSYLSDAIEVDVDRAGRRPRGVCLRHHGAHRGSRHPLGRLGLLAAAAFAVARDHTPSSSGSRASWRWR